MGSILIASCKKCGFEKSDIFYGGGMIDFIEVCNVPAINKRTGQMVVKNIFKKHSKNIAFYTEPSMYKGKLGKNRHQWGEIYLRKFKNHCPQCQSFSLSFHDIGCWD
jgi:hypothetical protein